MHESIFVPMAKWCMLLAGNYRCVQQNEMRTINDAVHTDLTETREVYEWVSELCVSLGASISDMVPSINMPMPLSRLLVLHRARALVQGTNIGR